MTLMFYMISASIRIRASSGWWVPTSMFGDKANHKAFSLSTFVWLKCLKNLIGLKKPWTFMSYTTEKFHMEMEPFFYHPRKKRNIIWTIHLHSKGFRIFTFPGCGQLLNMIPNIPNRLVKGTFNLNQLEKIVFPLISFSFQLIFLAFHGSKLIYH